MIANHSMGQRALVSALFAGLTFWLGYAADRADFWLLIGSYALFFAAYVFLWRRPLSATDIRWYVLTGMALRGLLLFAFPNLSDDIYRFVWDGQLIINGYNPFDYLPNYYIEHNILPEVLTPELYNSLNSPQYYTIYPPVLQAIFAVSVWLFPNSIAGAAIVMKSFLLVAEFGSITLIIRLLNKLHLPAQNVLLYALNPLAILEIVGNLHFEGLMIFFLLLSLWWLMALPTPAGRALSAAAFAFSVATKLLPLMFLPFLIHPLGWRRSIYYFTLLGGILCLLFTPLFSSFFIQNFGESLNLYFRRFEFNASVFYIAKWIGYAQTGRNLVKIIGPILATFTLLIIIILVIARQKKDWLSLPESWLFAISIYLLNTTTVHPWYILLPLLLSVFTRWRYAVVWSGLVWLSYSHYQGGEFRENYLLITLEYALVLGWWAWEASAVQLGRPTTS